MAPKTKTTVSDPHKTGAAELARELQAVHEHLCSIDQCDDVSAIYEAIPSTLPGTLCSPALLGHRDKAVRLLAACAVASLLRLFAPNAPFDKAQLGAIFAAFWRELKGLADERSPLHHLCFFLLKSLVLVRSAVLVWETEDVDGCLMGLLHCVFDGLSGSVKSKQVRVHLSDLLQSVFEEVGDAQIPWTCIEFVLGQYESVDAGPRSLAVDVLKGCAARLQLPLAQHYADLVSETAAVDAEAEADLRRLNALLPKLARESPLLVVNIVPQLEQQLLADSHETRSSAVRTVASILVALPRQDSQSIWATWLGRRNDKQVSVRLVWLRAAANILSCSPDPVLLSFYLERFEDPDATVRLKAVEGVKEVQGCDPSPDLTDAILERCKDKKEPVREAALALLTKYSLALHRLSINGLFRLLFIHDPPVRLQYELAIEEMLVDAGKDRIPDIVGQLDDDSFGGFKLFLRSKAVCIKHMQAFCLLHDRSGATGQGGAAAKLQQLIQLMAERCKYPVEAAASLANIAHLKDGDEVLAAFKALKNPSTPASASSKLLLYLQSEHRGDSLLSVAKRASHQVFNQEFIACLLASANGKHDRLLTALLSEFPQLFASYGSELEDLVIQSGLDPTKMAAFYRFLRARPSGYRLKGQLMDALLSLLTELPADSRPKIKQAGLIVAVSGGDEKDGGVLAEMLRDMCGSLTVDNPQLHLVLQAVASVSRHYYCPALALAPLLRLYDQLRANDLYARAHGGKYPAVDSLDRTSCGRVLLLRLLVTITTSGMLDSVEAAQWRRNVLGVLIDELRLPDDLSLIKSPYLGKVRWTAGKGAFKLLGPEVSLKTLTSHPLLQLLQLSSDPIEGVRMRFYSFIGRTCRTSSYMCCVLALAAHDPSFALRSSVLSSFMLTTLPWQVLDSLKSIVAGWRREDVRVESALAALLLLLSVDPDYAEGVPAEDHQAMEACVDFFLSACLSRDTLALLFATAACLKQYSLLEPHFRKSHNIYLLSELTCALLKTKAAHHKWPINTCSPPDLRAVFEDVFFRLDPEAVSKNMMTIYAKPLSGKTDSLLAKRRSDENLENVCQSNERVN